MKEIVVVYPDISDKAYKIAADEFVKYFERATGYAPKTDVNDDGVSDLVLIGSPAVNTVAAQFTLEDCFAPIPMKMGSDDFAVKTYRVNGRKILLLQGGLGRSTLYAVYSYFEKNGCAWYWDGDVVPNLSFEKLWEGEFDYKESTNFAYRGLRYFAHRGCKRFQAEMWGFEDWKKEIDYLLKKKLNLFMLRIGQDDLFQKAFPETVSYPNEETMSEFNYSSEDKNDYWGAQGYNDRRPFWSLRYRGELRKKILDYAFDRGLIHPEDCGTMTHWYSPTPDDFLKNNSVDFIAPCGARSKNTLVFDIRKDSNFDYYTKLTKAHIEHYGKAEIFHTIGFAEQVYSLDKAKNLRMKKYVYDRYLGYLSKEYPTCPLFIAAWDLWLTYEPNEVAELVSNLDENKCIIFDYTSDATYTNNFTKWNVVGNFPYIFGIFHAYESGNDMNGRYDITQERLEIAKKDKFCKGVILWPELSHSDTLMQEFFAVNAWENQVVSVEECIDRISKGRAGKYATEMKAVWMKFLPTVKLMHWNMREDTAGWYASYHYYTPKNYLSTLQNKQEDGLINGLERSQVKKAVASALEAVQGLVGLSQEAYQNQWIVRDAIDICRTVVGRVIHILMINEGLVILSKQNKQEKEKTLRSYALLLENLFDALQRILSSMEEFSLYHTLIGLSKESRVYDGFEQTLKNNTVADYCRTNIYETVRELFIPEQTILQQELLRYVTDETYDMQSAFAVKQKEILQKYMETPLAEIARAEKHTVQDAIQFAYETLKNTLEKVEL